MWRGEGREGETKAEILIHAHDEKRLTGSESGHVECAEVTVVLTHAHVLQVLSA